MKSENSISARAWIRLIIFILVAGGIIWFFNAQTQPSSADLLPAGMAEKTKVLGEAVEKIIPPKTRRLVQQHLEEKIIQQSRKTIEKNEIIEEVKKTIEGAAEQISGFPEKQKKELKKQIIKQTCEELLEDLE